MGRRLRGRIRLLRVRALLVELEVGCSTGGFGFGDGFRERTVEMAHRL